ncbi:MAG TPA: hypothetical protein VEZ13_20495 [Brevibacillus sp.]|nr:hypothetical protein [Brevibacillus sp.]
MCYAYLKGRGLPSDLLDIDVDPYKQKLFIMACQVYEIEEMEKQRNE